MRYFWLLSYLPRRNTNERQLLNYLRNQRPTTWILLHVLNMMNSDFDFSRWSDDEWNNLFRIHIKVCNYMARSGQRVFYLSPFHSGKRNGLGLDLGRKAVGVGTGNIEVDDMILLVPSVKVPLVFRKNADGSVRLIGLALVSFVNSGEVWSHLSKDVKLNLSEFIIR